MTKNNCATNGARALLAAVLIGIAGIAPAWAEDVGIGHASPWLRSVPPGFDPDDLEDFGVEDPTLRVGGDKADSATLPAEFSHEPDAAEQAGTKNLYNWTPSDESSAGHGIAYSDGEDDGYGGYGEETEEEIEEPEKNWEAGKKEKDVAVDEPAPFDPRDLENFTPFVEQVRSGSVDELREAADAGDPQAQYALGLHFLNSEDVDRSSRTAVGLFRKAAESGYVPAKAKLGECYYNDVGVFQDYGEAARLAGEAAAEGYPPAIYLLADCHAGGQGVPQDWDKARELFLEAARKGYAPALSVVAYQYAYGRDPFEKDPDFALRLHHIAAEHGSLASQGVLAYSYNAGDGVPEDEEESMKWRRRMADQGDYNALYRVADADGTAREQRERDELAAGFKDFLAAAEAGDAQAQVKAGDCYANGYGVERDRRLAFEWYRKAALQDLPEAQVKLGGMYFPPIWPEGGRNEFFDEDKAVEWYRKADAVDYPPAATKLAIVYSQYPATTGKMIEMVMKAAHGGDSEGQTFTSLMYRKGEVVERNGTLANVWLLKALRGGSALARSNFFTFCSMPASDVMSQRMKASQGDAPAMTSIALHHYMGLAMDQDNEIASQWYRKAAEAGDDNAQYSLGLMLMEGEGIPRDVPQGVEWLRKAADQGNALAQTQCGIHYLGDASDDAPGVPRDCETAIDYLTRAAESGFAKAQYTLATVYRDGLCDGRKFGQAEKLMIQAADQGLPQAVYDLGVMYSKQRGVKADYPRAKKLFEQAAAQYGETRALTRLGEMALAGDGMDPDPTLARTYFMMAGERGDPEGRLMHAYLTALFDPQLAGAGKDAKAQMIAAAESGDPVGQYILGLYYYGLGAHSEAAEWIRKAAGQGETRAVGMLGYLYENGEGVERDVDEAIRLYREIAETGDLLSQQHIVQLLQQKKDWTADDYKELLKWSLQRLGQGDMGVLRTLAALYADENAPYADERMAQIWEEQADEAEKRQ